MKEKNTNYIKSNTAAVSNLLEKFRIKKKNGDKLFE